MARRLLILSPTPMRGGAEEYLLAVAAAAREGWDVTVCFELGPPTASLAHDVRRLEARVRYLDLPIRGTRRWRVYGQTLATIAALVRVRPDVAMVVTPWPTLVTGNVIGAALLGVPTAVVFQLAPFTVPVGRAGGWARRARRRRQRWVAVSEQNAETLRTIFDLGADEVQTISNGGPEAPALDDEGRALARAALRRELGLDPDTRVVITVARLSAQKGHADLLEALTAVTGAGRHADVSFVWVGEGELRAELADAVAAGGLDGRVTLLGHRDDVGALLDGADLFVLPSHFEGLPFALLEALAHGVPVVVSDAGGMPEVVRDGVDGLIHARRSADDLAAKLCFALDHPDRMCELAISGRERSAQYTSARMLRETMALLDQLGSG
jgi:glycosyltransferase involved in cell wall biosynthesis